MSFWRRFRGEEEEELPPPVVRRPRTEVEAPSPKPEVPTRGKTGKAAEEASLLGTGLHWEGALSGRGKVRIEGSFKGVLRVKGEVVVGPNGRVEAEEVEALTVIVEGYVQTPVVRARHVVLKRTCHLIGNIVTTTLEAESGSYLKGQVQMEENLRFSWEASEETGMGEAPSPSSEGGTSAHREEAGSPEAQEGKQAEESAVASSAQADANLL